MPERPHLVLVLQGGGARAAYQVGVYEALVEHGLEVDWVVGVSTGAMNAAVIAGNAPGARADRLRALWRSVQTVTDPAAALPAPFAGFARLALAGTAAFGRRGIYTLRPPVAGAPVPGGAPATSLYSFAPLRRTLSRHLDEARIGAPDAPRLCIGAVDVESGRARFFDSAREDVGIDAVVAAGSMPPAAAPVRIDDRLYWDASLAGGALPGLLDLVLRGEAGHRGLVALVVDVQPDAPRAPRDLLDALARRQELACAAASDAQVSRFLRGAGAGIAGADLLEVPDEAAAAAPLGPIGVVRLTHGSEGDLGWAGELDFTPSALARRIEAGREHTRTALTHTPVDFDLFGADPEPDLFVHTLREGELVLSQRRPMPAYSGAGDPADPPEAISLEMRALPVEDDPDATRSWTNIRALRLEKSEDDSGG